MTRQHFTALAALAGLALLLAAPGHAADKPALAFLTEADVEPTHLLPPPPVDGSAQARDELAELRRIAAVTTPAQFEQAKWDDEHEDGTIFQSAIAPAFDLSKLPATARLLAEVRNEESVAGKAAKTYFKRNRPWIVDPKLKTCARDDPPQSSYPSGHATMAFSMAVVLTKAMPELSGNIMGRARDYAYHRMVCGMHYRADIVAGQTLGVAVAAQMLNDPRFQADLAAAREELKAAGLTGQAG
jgi:acid phosphatase (class A)